MIQPRSHVNTKHVCVCENSASQVSMRHQDLRTNRDGNNLSYLTNFVWIRGGSEWSTYESVSVVCVCNVRSYVSWGLMWHPDIAVVMQNFVLLNKFGSRDGSDWSINDTLSFSCECLLFRREVLSSLSRHPSIRTGRDAKITEQLWIQRCVWLEQLLHPVSAMCMQRQIWCILRIDATPRHSNFLKGKNFLYESDCGIRDGFDLEKYHCLSASWICTVR